MHTIPFLAADRKIPEKLHISNITFWRWKGYVFVVTTFAAPDNCQDRNQNNMLWNPGEDEITPKPILSSFGHRQLDGVYGPE
jgi:hypothetical protein